MLKVGVIGASGFIGSRVTELLSIKQAVEVRPITRSSATPSYLKYLNLQSYAADALNLASLRKALSGCDAAIYCAAGNPWFIRKSIITTYHAAHQTGVRRLIYLSSASVHGQAPKPGTDESTPLDAHQFLAYNNAKVKAEQSLLQLRQQGTTEIVILRPGIVVGPRSSWVVQFANSLLDGTAYIVNDGQGICNSIYIDNLVHATHLALTEPEADGQAFLVGDRETVRWADLYRPIAQAFGINFSQISNIQCSGMTSSLKEWIREALWNSDMFGGWVSFLSNKLKKSKTESLTQPDLNQEMIDLYLCNYKLPSQKAERILNYSPIVSFAEANEYTVQWLASIGYPVKN